VNEETRGPARKRKKRSICTVWCLVRLREAFMAVREATKMGKLWWMGKLCRRGKVWSWSVTLDGSEKSGPI